MEALTLTTIDADQVHYEYASFQGQPGTTVARINDLDAEGWQLVNVFAAAGGWDNKYYAVLRRTIDPLPTPDDTAPGWYPDPSGRYTQRWWNGDHWTHDAARDGKQYRDAPTLRAPTPGLSTT